MGTTGHPCSTIQGSAQYLSLTTVQMLREASVFSSLDQANNPCSTVQALRGVSVFDRADLCWTNNHYPRPVLNVVVNHYKLALLPTASRDKALLIIIMQFSIGKIIKRRQN